MHGTPQDYERSLQYHDRIIGQIIAQLESSGRFDNALLVVTSDHGCRYDPTENRDRWKTAPVFRRVPLLFKLPGQKSRHPVDKTIYNNHLLPILERCNLPAAVAQAVHKKQAFKRAEKELASIRGIENLRLVNWTDPEYPKMLREIYEQPDAIRRTLESDAGEFPRDVMELQSYFADDGQTGIRATPGAGAKVDLWILGSSLFGAQLAAALGLPYAFASHFAPGLMDEAIESYRRNFRPSAALAKPHLMLGFNVFAADSDEEAELLASSQQQAFVALRTGNPQQLPPPVAGYRESLGPQGARILDHVLECSAVGSAATVARGIAAFVARTGVDEVMVASAISYLLFLQGISANTITAPLLLESVARAQQYMGLSFSILMRSVVPMPRSPSAFATAVS